MYLVIQKLTFTDQSQGSTSCRMDIYFGKRFDVVHSLRINLALMKFPQRCRYFNNYYPDSTCKEQKEFESGTRLGEQFV